MPVTGASGCKVSTGAAPGQAAERTCRMPVPAEGRRSGRCAQPSAGVSMSNSYKQRSPLDQMGCRMGGSKTIAAALYLISKNKDVDEVAVKA
jgi:hypothetical protein